MVASDRGVRVRAAFGRRETTEAGFQVGVQRMLPVERNRLWELIVDSAGRDICLGAHEGFEFESGHFFEPADGTTGEVAPSHSVSVSG